MKKKNKILISIITVVVILLVIGVSYALWVITKEQTGENIVNTACLEISIDDEAGDISLQKAFPIEDSEGETLKPYTFTITNKCNDMATYQINLESLNKVAVENRLNPDYLKVKLNELGKEGIKNILGNLSTTDTTIADTYESHKLLNGYLEPNDTKNFELRLWIDENVTKDDEVMDKQFKSKISVTSTYIEEDDVLTFSDAVVKCGQSGAAATTCITDNMNLDETLINDDFGNLRYTGATPNNYIDIGDRDNEGQPILWRIIGVMNNITTLGDEEKQENLLKVIRADSIGNLTMDSSQETINAGLGVNEWSDADLMKVLNPESVYTNLPTIGKSLFWNKESGKCYWSYKEDNRNCDFTNTGLDTATKERIAKVRWNTGSINDVYDIINTNKLTAKYMYKSERSNHNGKEQCANDGGSNCNDNVERTTVWNGYVGLVYPSDYLYAVGGNVRSECLEKSMNTWDNDSCKDNDWLKLGNSSWTMTSSPYISSSNSMFFIDESGFVRDRNCYLAYGVYPVAYLKSSIKIIGGTGEKSSPFILE